MACGLHTALSSSFWPPVPLLPLFPFYPFSSHSFNSPESLSLSSWWLKRQAMLVLLQRGGGGVVLGIAEVDKAALGWPTYGHWPGRLMVAVGGRAVVVVVWGKRLTLMCCQLDVGVWNDFAHFQCLSVRLTVRILRHLVQKRAGSLISQWNFMKKNGEFTEVVLHYNRIEIIF